MKKILFLTTFVVFIFIPISINADVIINEIAWMGTKADHNDEWIELYNPTNQEVDLGGWVLEAADGTPSIELTASISIGGYFLLERSNDNSIPDIMADQIYVGALSNDGEHLKLKNKNGGMVDEVVNCEEGWCAGNNETKQTMERTATDWQTSLNPDGTPKDQNSSGATEEPEQEEPTEQPSPPPTVGENQPPIADAGNNIIGFIGQEIEFDGTDSSDPDEDELFYSWNMGDGKVIDKPSFTYKYSYPGTYLVTLTVSDGQDYALDTITVKIQPQQITINEFIPNPEGKDEENEWIVPQNNRVLI